MNKREVLNIASYYSGASFFLRKYKNVFSSDLPILAYHRVLDVKYKNFDGDIELISASSRNFENQIKYICKYYNPITFIDIANNTIDNNKNKKPPIILTFDDGFKDNYEVVFPILKKYNIKATFFIVTNVVDKIEPLWFELLAQQVITCRNIDLDINGKNYSLSDNRKDRRKALSKLLLDLRDISNQQRLEILDKITNTQAFSNCKIDTENYLTWANVKEMHNEGMEFGSHSMSHPILASMTDDNILEEIMHSKSRIENELGSNCITFSYPVGGFEEYNSYAVTALKNCNYKFSCTYEPGLNKFPLVDPYQLRRIHIERYTSLHTFKNVIISSFFSYK